MGEAGADGEAITVIRVAEAEIGADLSRRLQSLLQACFPGYPGRSYFKLPPHFRHVAMTGGGDVAAQMGVEFRVIRAGGTVLPDFRGRRLVRRGRPAVPGPGGRGLLAEVTELARSCGMAFVVLFADDAGCRPGTGGRGSRTAAPGCGSTTTSRWDWPGRQIRVP